MQTAKNPAPRPDRIWVKLLSENPGIFNIVCTKSTNIKRSEDMRDKIIRTQYL